MATFLQSTTTDTSSCFSFPMARSTPTSVPLAPCLDIISNIRVSFRAMGFPRVISRDGISATDIFPHSDDLQMGRIDTTPVAAEVVKRHSGRDWTNKHLIGDSMSQTHLIVSNCNLPIPPALSAIVTSHKIAVPFPAFIRKALSYFGPESSFNRNRHKTSANRISHRIQFTIRDTDMATGGI